MVLVGVILKDLLDLTILWNIELDFDHVVGCIELRALGIYNHL